VIKVVAPAQRHPSNRPLPDFHRYWAETHGPLFANTTSLRRYVQHLTLPEAYGGDPAPTYDGVSMFWYDELKPEFTSASDAEMAELIRSVIGTRPADVVRAHEPPALEDAASALVRAVFKDDMQLFDRSLGWPMHEKRALVVARELAIVDGEASPEMVKAIFISSKLPGLTLSEFFERWQHSHGALVARTPGLRRYVQNHALPAAYAGESQTHDGWSELWFDDLDALRRAVASPEWRAVRDHAGMLFAQPAGVGVARERVQKHLGWEYNDWGVGAMDPQEVRRRLLEEGYTTLAADPDGPGKLRRAAANQALAIWNREHLVTIDETHLDVRPER
jgi:uncharacterized protein (TIGR02118 family)